MTLINVRVLCVDASLLPRGAVIFDCARAQRVEENVLNVLVFYNRRVNQKRFENGVL